MILRRLRASGIQGVAEASCFFGAVDTGTWQDVRAAIEGFGSARPHEIPAVLAGARRTFAAVGDWMDCRRWSSE